MALPPFNELRLKPGEKPSQQRLEELFGGVMRNLEDAYERLGQLEEGRIEGGFVKAVTSGQRRMSWGAVTFEWAGGSLYSKEVSTAHGLGASPKVFFEPIGVALVTAVTEKSNSSFKAKAYETNTAVPPVAGTKVTFDWFAIA